MANDPNDPTDLYDLNNDPDDIYYIYFYPPPSVAGVVAGVLPLAVVGAE